MRGQLTFKIEGYDKAIVIRELTMKQILTLFQFKGLQDIKAWSDIVNYLQEQILPMVTNLTPDELLEFTPSEIEIIYQKIKEVNKVFFGLTRTPALKAVFDEIKPQLLAAFGSSFADLSRLDIPMPKSMDILISSTQPTKTSESELSGSN